MGEIVNVHESYDRDRVDRWQFDVREDDGGLRGYVMPIHWLPQVAAEYGLPMDDFETLLDIALHTAHVDDELDKGNDPAELVQAREGNQAKLSANGRRVTLQNATSLDHVKDVHLQRIESVKQNGRRIEMPKPGKKPMVPVRLAANGELEEEEVDVYAKLQSLKDRFGPDMEIRTGREKTTIGEFHSQANKDLDSKHEYRRNRNFGTE